MSGSANAPWHDAPSQDTLPGLTVSQPYAEAIVSGRKTLETRTWATTYRGLLALHAGGAWWQERALGGREAERRATELAERLGLALPVAAYPRRALVGVARLVECFTFTPESWEALREAHGVYTAWRPGLVGWRLAEVRRLPAPVPWRGALGLFPVPHTILGLPHLDAGTVHGR